MSSLSEDPDQDSDVAEPFRFHFEVAYEVANKGACVCVTMRLHTRAGVARVIVQNHRVAVTDLGTRNMCSKP